MRQVFGAGEESDEGAALLRGIVAQGAAELSRHAVGTPVFAGMIAASAIGLFVIPMLYVTFQTIRERSGTVFRRLDAYRRLSAADVRKAARRYLTQEARTIVRVVPEEDEDGDDDGDGDAEEAAE